MKSIEKYWKALKQQAKASKCEGLLILKSIEKNWKSLKSFESLLNKQKKSTNKVESNTIHHKPWPGEVIKSPGLLPTSFLEGG